jgi:hypothetical protein
MCEQKGKKCVNRLEYISLFWTSPCPFPIHQIPQQSLEIKKPFQFYGAPLWCPILLHFYGSVIPSIWSWTEHSRALLPAQAHTSFLFLSYPLTRVMFYFSRPSHRTLSVVISQNKGDCTVETNFPPVLRPGQWETTRPRLGVGVESLSGILSASWQRICVACDVTLTILQFTFHSQCSLQVHNYHKRGEKKKKLFTHVGTMGTQIHSLNNNNPIYIILTSERLPALMGDVVFTHIFSLDHHNWAKLWGEKSVHKNKSCPLPNNCG